MMHGTTPNSVATATRLLPLVVRTITYLSSIGLAQGHVGNDQMRLDTVLAWQLAADDKNTGGCLVRSTVWKGGRFDNHWPVVRRLLGWGNHLPRCASNAIHCFSVAMISCFIGLARDPPSTLAPKIIIN
jgi:hypothetical protein